MKHPTKTVPASHRAHYGLPASAVAFAPGRIEVLGNHTDYNEGYVLSAAIDAGICFALSARRDGLFRVYAADIAGETTFDAARPEPDAEAPWSNYVRGVWRHLLDRGAGPAGVDATFAGDIPMGAGLSSSAALEVAAALALSRQAALALEPMDTARLCREAEERYAGVRCGLLDQITSLYGCRNRLVFTDFRTLRVQRVPAGNEACFVLCNTGVKHSLVESQYNERRAQCEAATAYFQQRLDRPVAALRDVTMADWERLHGGLDALIANRAAHVIGENQRVLSGARCLARGDLRSFGRLMFASHESSRDLYENSCPELDFLVEQARALPGAYGARLSGGGFGGSVLVLAARGEAERVAEHLAAAYKRVFAHQGETMIVSPAQGAHLILP